MKIAIIPARGGSKRIPGKNIRPFMGAPIIGYSIAAALESGCFDRVMVSTDDPRIAETAEKLGAEEPFLRAPDLAGDMTPIKDVMRDAIRWHREQQGEVSHICCLYATAPFLRPADIREGLERLQAMPDANFSISVTPFSFPIQRALKIRDGGQLAMRQPEHNLTRSQDLEQHYHDAGQFFWATDDAMMAHDTIFDSNCCPVIIPPHRAQDIDTEDDWLEAELKYRLLNEHREPAE